MQVQPSVNTESKSESKAYVGNVCLTVESESEFWERMKIQPAVNMFVGASEHRKKSESKAHMLAMFGWQRRVKISSESESELKRTCCEYVVRVPVETSSKSPSVFTMKMLLMPALMMTMIVVLFPNKDQDEPKMKKGDLE